MVIHDINQNKREVILLIHPMNFSGKMMMDSMAKELGCEYRYIVPDLSGHGEAKDDPYVTCWLIRLLRWTSKILKIWQGYGHCEEMTQNTEAYMAFVKGCMD